MATCRYYLLILELSPIIPYSCQLTACYFVVLVAAGTIPTRSTVEGEPGIACTPRCSSLNKNTKIGAEGLV